MKRTPLVSVIMPAFNCELYIGEAIKSILSQTFTDYEFIIIDDGSDDLTLTIIEEYKKKDDRIKIIINKENIGLIKSLNIGLSIAKGKYIARMDGDDIAVPTRFERQIAYLNRHPDVGVLGTRAEIIEAEGRKTGSYIVPAKHSMIVWALIFDRAFAHPTIMMRARVIKKVGGYTEDYKAVEDFLLWTKLAEQTKFANLPENLLLYRSHSQSTSRRKRILQIENVSIIRQQFISGIIEKSIPLEVIDWLRRSQKPDHSLSMDQINQVVDLMNELFEKMVKKRIILPCEANLVHTNLLKRIENVYKNRLTLLRWVYIIIHKVKRKILRAVNMLLKEKGKI